MSDLAEQTRNAFDFIDKLFLETSYLIREVEGQLNQTSESFVIIRPSGYGVTTVSSTGLETKNVGAWLRKRVSVAFVPESMTDLRGGQTHTGFTEELKVLFLTVVFRAEELKEPTVFFGFADDIVNKNKNYKKFEHLLWEFAASAFNMFNSGPKIAFEDGYCSIKGKVRKLKLYSLETNDDVRSKLVEPMTRMYRG